MANDNAKRLLRRPPSQLRCDLVVVGAGLAGLAAACRGAELGLRVVVLEQGRDDSYECNTRLSGGVLVVGGLTSSAPAEDLASAVVRVTHGTIDPDLAEVLVTNAGRVTDWLVQHGAELISLTFQPGQTFSDVIGPTGLASTGRSWRGMGSDALLRRLGSDTKSLGGEILLNHRALHLRVVRGRVSGVDVDHGGRVVVLHANATLLADGGFHANAQLVGRHISPKPDCIFVRGACTGQGWGMTAAADIGAKLVNLDSFYGHLLSADVFHNDRLWPYPILDPLVEVGIVVDRHGDRFTNERLGGIDVTNKLARRPDPFGYVVCDNDAWNGPATQMSFPPPIRPWLEANGGAVMRADTIKGLAESTGMVLERLAASVDRFNRTQDSDVFSSSPTPTAERQIYAGPMPTGPSRIAEPPFVAIPVVPGITFTMGGPLVDINARVLHQSGGLIEGLYAAGASCGGFDGGADVGYVGGLMKAAITGVVAAEHVHRALLTKL